MDTALEARIAAIEAVLPQTQCRQCGFDGCRPYAAALASGTAETDRCPPGGDLGAQRLATLLDRAYRPVDPQYGTPKQVATRVVIDESICIGCTKCIQACPVDAIVGANQVMHTVIVEECTGCELCIPPCPVDCIAVVPAQPLGIDYGAHVEAQRPLAHARHHARATRLERLREEQVEARSRRREALQEEAIPANAIAPTPASADDPVARAIAAARARRARQSRGPTER